MTAIVGIAAKELPRHEHGQPKPSKDFSQELSKQHVPSHDDVKAPIGDEKAELHEATVSESSKPDVSLELFHVEMLDQVRAVPVDQLSEAMQPLDRATAQPVGVTEALLGARVFGWHALAQSYLSELAAFDVVPAGDMPPAEAPVSLMPMGSRAPVGTIEEAPAAIEAPATAQASAASPDAEQAPEAGSAGDPVDASAPSMAVMASADCWAERSLRFTRQSDGQGVAWLRDYRLDPDKAGQVVRLVLQEARTKGFTLDRIMLNGREAWSSRGQV